MLTCLQCQCYHAAGSRDTIYHAHYLSLVSHHVNFCLLALITVSWGWFETVTVIGSAWNLCKSKLKFWCCKIAKFITIHHDGERDVCTKFTTINSVFLDGCLWKLSRPYAGVRGKLKGSPTLRLGLHKETFSDIILTSTNCIKKLLKESSINSSHSPAFVPSCHLSRVLHTHDIFHQK